MGLQASIELTFFESKSDEIFLCLLNSGWNYIIDGKVNILVEEGKHDINLLTYSETEFFLEKFLTEIKHLNKFGMSIITKDKIGGEFIIENNTFIFMPTINRKYLNNKKDIIDFSWYLNQLEPLYENFTIINTECTFNI